MMQKTITPSLADNLANRKESLTLQLTAFQSVAEPLFFEKVVRPGLKETRFRAICAYCDRKFSPELFANEKELIARAFSSHEGPVSAQEFSRIAQFVIDGGAA